MKRSKAAKSWLLSFLRKFDLLLQRIRRALTPPEITIFRDVTAHWLQSALGVAIELELADRTPLDGGLDVSEFCSQFNLKRGRFLRLVRVLSAHGYFRLSDGENRLSHTRLSEALRRGVTCGFASLQTRDWYRNAFTTKALTEALSGTESAFALATGEEFFPHLLDNPERLALFAGAMSDITRFCVPFILEQIEVDANSCVLDIGGSDGELCLGLAKLQPEAKFAVLDQGERSFESPLVDYLEGDFFQEVPTGFDHLILKNILHDWTDSECRQLLQSCARASHSQGRLTLIEVLLPESGEDLKWASQEFTVDWNMLATLPGRERRRSEFERTLAESGWCLVSAKPTATPFWILEARLNP